MAWSAGRLDIHNDRGRGGRGQSRKLRDASQSLSELKINTQKINSELEVKQGYKISRPHSIDILAPASLLAINVP